MNAHAYPWIRIDWPTERMRCTRCKTAVTLSTTYLEGLVAASQAFLSFHASCTEPVSVEEETNEQMELVEGRR